MAYKVGILFRLLSFCYGELSSYFWQFWSFGLPDGPKSVPVPNNTKMGQIINENVGEIKD